MLPYTDSNEPYMRIPATTPRSPVPPGGPLECIIAGHEGGELNQYSAKVRWVRPTSIRMILCERQDEPGVESEGQTHTDFTIF